MERMKKWVPGGGAYPTLLHAKLRRSISIRQLLGSGDRFDKLLSTERVTFRLKESSDWMRVLHRRFREVHPKIRTRTAGRLNKT